MRPLRHRLGRKAAVTRLVGGHRERERHKQVHPFSEMQEERQGVVLSKKTREVTWGRTAAGKTRIGTVERGYTPTLTKGLSSYLKRDGFRQWSLGSGEPTWRTSSNVDTDPGTETVTDDKTQRVYHTRQSSSKGLGVM
eukprot:scpid78306/ scgid12499/ 